MKMKHLDLILAAVIATLTLHSSHAAITISVIPASAPNAYGSPSYAAWQANAVYALEHGLTSYGDPNSPTYYTQAPRVMSVMNNLVTGFASWNGAASPAGAYASELGNRLQFGVDIKGNGQQISISGLSFVMQSTDPSDSLGYSYGIGGYDYSAGYVGWLYGADGVRSTSDDVFITSGPNTQLVDEIVGRGSGNAWWPSASDALAGASNQEIINAAAQNLGGVPIDFTGTYTYGDVQGAATVTFTPVPEPTTLIAGALLLLPFGASALRIVRKNRKE